MRKRGAFEAVKKQKNMKKQLFGMLVSCMCGILLCAGCLAGSTWAWMTARVENKDNVICIGEPTVTVTTGGVNEETGAQIIGISHANEEDDFKQKSVLYVTLIIQKGTESLNIYTTLNGDNEYKHGIEILGAEGANLNWVASWVAPANAVEMTSNVIDLTKWNTVTSAEPPVKSTQPTEETTAPTEQTTEESSEPEASSEPEESSEPSSSQESTPASSEGENQSGQSTEKENDTTTENMESEQASVAYSEPNSVG